MITTHLVMFKFTPGATASAAPAAADVAIVQAMDSYDRVVAMDSYDRELALDSV